MSASSLPHRAGGAAVAAAGTTTTTNAYRPSVHLRTKLPSKKSFGASLADDAASTAGGSVVVATDASGARFWIEKYGLGKASAASKKKKSKFAHPRKLNLKVGTSSVVHAVLFAPASAEELEVDDAAAGNNINSSRRRSNNKSWKPLAAVCGPRVKLYGTTSQSAFYRRLYPSSSSQQTSDSSPFGEEEEERGWPEVGGTSSSFVDDLPADRQVQTGGELATSADFRSDGRLLAVGTDGGCVRISDVTTRATLCQFRPPSSTAYHLSLPIRALCWFRDGRHVLAAGDDGRVRVWSLKSSAASLSSSGGGGSAPVLELSGHGDAVRSATLWQNPIRPPRSANATDALASSSSWPYRSVAISGGYDHTVRLWNVDDLEEDGGDSATTASGVDDRCLSVLVHGGPVEAVMAMPSSVPDIPFWLISAGGTTVKVWNPRTGTCVQDLDARHRKTITCLLAIPREISDPDDLESPTYTTTRIVTAGLDGLLRIHAWSGSTGTLRFIHGIALGDAVTSMAYSSEANRLAIGTADGRVLVRQRGPSVSTGAKKRPRPGTYSFFTRGMSVGAAAGDYVVGEGSGKKRKLKGYDLALKQFRYGDALDEALETRYMHIVVTVLEELGKRRGLALALSNRDEETLEPILSFLVRYIARPQTASLLIGVANMLLDIYGDIKGQSETIDELLDKLKKAVKLEARTQRKLLKVMGQIDALVAASTMKDTSTLNTFSAIEES